MCPYFFEELTGLAVILASTTALKRRGHRRAQCAVLLAQRIAGRRAAIAELLFIPECGLGLRASVPGLNICFAALVMAFIMMDKTYECCKKFCSGQ